MLFQNIYLVFYKVNLLKRNINLSFVSLLIPHRLVMSLFSTGLKNFLELIYIFGNRLSISTEAFFNLTPLDSKVLVNIYNKDIEEQNKELQNKRNE